MLDILWRAADNDWFEYPMGSLLLHLRFPKRYQSQALEGVRVMFTGEGPTEMKSQPPLKNDEKQVLCNKIIKFVNKRYITLLKERFVL